MRCGAKCFLVRMEVDGKKQVKSVIARTPAEARKRFREEYGVKPQIISVRESNNDRLNNTKYK